MNGIDWLEVVAFAGTKRKTAAKEEPRPLGQCWTTHRPISNLARHEGSPGVRF